MVDPLDRRSFNKPKVVDQHFHSIVKMIRHELNEDCKTLFFDHDLQKRTLAFKNLMTMTQRFTASLKELTPEQKKDLLAALQQDQRKLQNALRAISVHTFLQVDGIHIPVLDKNSNKPFTLFDFFNDPFMLSEKLVTFQYHALRFNSKLLAKTFPGMDDPHLKAEIQKHRKTHFPFEHAGIQYTFTPSNPSGYTISGTCPIKELSHSIKFEIPHGVMPSDLNVALDALLRPL